MEDVLLIDAAERYLKGQMDTQEKKYFEELRKNNPELDQHIVEQIFFLNELDRYSEIVSLKHSLHETVSKLTNDGIIKENPLKGNAKLIFLWKKYKKTISVAASIAGIVSILIATLSSIVSHQKNGNLKPLVEKIKEQDNKYQKLEKQIGQLNSANSSNNNNIKPKLESKFRATGFLIDVNNKIIVTNAHVLNEAKNKIVVEDNKGAQFSANILFVSQENDLAILKITDNDFKKYNPVPFTIKKSSAELGEQIFMLGYPKQEIVYNEGYISAKNGYQMDTVFCQISAAANEGNSGSPVINKNGELLGVISSMETNAEGVVFAIKSSYIQTAINEINKNSSPADKIKITSYPILRGNDRVTQIKRLQDYVFMIKGN